MKKLLLFLLVTGFSFLGLAQQNQGSSVRKMLDNATRVKYEWDYANRVEFRSGIGEKARFTPATITDLNTGKVTKALYVELYVKASSMPSLNNALRSNDYYAYAWVSIDEVKKLIDFLEKYVVPNLQTKLVKKEIHYDIRATEMTISYHIINSIRKFYIQLNDYNNGNVNFNAYTFWTSTQINKIPELIEKLKTLVNS